MTADTTATQSLDLAALARSYQSGALKPSALIDAVFARIAARGDDAVWIHLLPKAAVLAAAQELEARKHAGDDLPLYGVPFAVKDNIDVAGLPTTAACPSFSHIAQDTAPVVAKLMAAGALLIGKTNLDQFATGLVGTRSPYGAPSCVFDADYISGGSSSGSAVAVAAGLVSFALGSDTAGSGRVPAAFNNIVGWKPTRGLLSSRGLVPACRTLDCISVFALTCDDASAVGQIVSGYDGADPYSRDGSQRALPSAFHFGVPAHSDLTFFGDTAAAALFDQAIATLESCGGRRVEIDFAPFREAAALLYDGPWVAERLAAIGPFLAEHPKALLPGTESIISAASDLKASDAFLAFYRLQELKRQTESTWRSIDVLAVPTAATIFKKSAVEADPLGLNSKLGYYTNFANLLDLAAVAVPAGFRSNGLPFGISLLAPAFTDDALCELAGRFHAARGGELGAMGTRLPSAAAHIHLAVVGAHLQGQPLNHQLTSRGAYLVTTTRTSTDYKLYALSGTMPPKPGLVRDPGFVGPGIELEVWAMNAAAFGTFVDAVPSPLAIGTAVLASGQQVKCFVCEPAALLGAEDITKYGGWRAYLARKDETSQRRDAAITTEK